MDEEYWLAAELAEKAGLVHPMDVVRFYESHNEYEWNIQRARNAINPKRTDRQLGILAASIAAVNSLADDKSEVFLAVMNVVQKCFEMKLPEEE